MAFITAPAVIHAQSKARQSQWVFANDKGKLEYKTMQRGDKIMDYSYAGYGGGGVSIPSVPVKITLQPQEGDNSDVIQHAIDQVAAMEPVNGFRGTVLLAPGTYSCEKQITISAGGIVLRGSGPGNNGTVINMTGKPHLCFLIKGPVSEKLSGQGTTITDAYVPSGTNSFTVADGSVFTAGDTIRITKPVTEAWVKFMGMDNLYRDGKKQTWVSGIITTDRVIQKAEGNKITVDVPLTDSYDAAYFGMNSVTINKITTTGNISQTGIEYLRIIAPEQSVTINDGLYRAVSIGGVTDGWVRGVDIVNTTNSLSITGKRITADNINITHTIPTKGAAKPADLNASGAQLLFNRCHITGDNVFFLATGAKVTGPVVLLNCVFKGNGWIQPHQRWATGLLIDGCEVPDGGIDFMNRGSMGSGHGWAIGWAVAWNCKAQSYLNQMPPGAANWVIGSKGQRQQKAMPFDATPLLPEGIYDAHGTPVLPVSLYLAQLEERLGKKAVENIGYK